MIPVLGQAAVNTCPVTYEISNGLTMVRKREGA